MIWRRCRNQERCKFSDTVVIRGSSSALPFFHFLCRRLKVGTCLSSAAAMGNYDSNRRCAVLMSAKPAPDGVGNKAFPAVPPSGITTSPLRERDHERGNELTPTQ